jgi:MoaA/NifB/PqqE/SkfB family radical SAM enzyme
MDCNPATAPHAVDLNLLGRCNLRCPFCWGPPHEQGAILSAKQWQTIIDKLAGRGTRAIILTGGEPLLRADLADICGFAKARQIRITLSTNGITLPAAGPRILPFVDELGLPLDGADEATNNVLRRSLGRLNHFHSFWEAIEFTRRNFPAIELTIRTVVSKRNADYVIDIGQRLRELGIAGLRWKLYQFVPIGYGRDVKDDLWIKTSCFRTIVRKIRARYPDLYIDTLDHDARDGRYLHILPNGDAMTPTRAHEEFPLGNALEDLDSVLANLAGRVDVARNRRHGGQRHVARIGQANGLNGTTNRPHLPHPQPAETPQTQDSVAPPAT